MKILNVGAKNFRTLEDINLNFESNYCTISGNNNAGKSAIVKIIQYFFDGGDENLFYNREEKEINFSNDRTQWSNSDHMEISVLVELDKNDDSEVFFVVEKYSKSEHLENEVISVELISTFRAGVQAQSMCKVDGVETEYREAAEIIKKNLNQHLT